MPQSLCNKVADLSSVTLFKKEVLAQVFSCEIYEIFKNTFFYRTPQVAAWVGVEVFINFFTDLRMSLALLEYFDSSVYN